MASPPVTSVVFSCPTGKLSLCDAMAKKCQSMCKRSRLCPGDSLEGMPEISALPSEIRLKIHSSCGGTELDGPSDQRFSGIESRTRQRSFATRMRLSECIYLTVAATALQIPKHTYTSARGNGSIVSKKARINDSRSELHRD